MFPLRPSLYFEIAAFAASVIFWYKIKHTRMRWLMFYLFLIVSVELAGRYISRELHKPNYWLYNISVPVEYLFYTALFYWHYTLSRNRILARWFLMLFPVFVLINLLAIQGLHQFNNNFLKIGSLSMIIFSCLYFYEILTSEEIIHPPGIPMFWIAIGVFLFNTGEFVYSAASDTLIPYWRKWRPTFQLINNNLIYVLYSFIIIAILSFLWTPQKK